MKKLSHPKKRKSKKKDKKPKSKSLMVTAKNDLIKNNYGDINIVEPITEKKLITNEEYNDYEMNNLPYEEAIKIDKRTYWEYYLSLIKTKELLIFSFLSVLLS